MVIRLSLGERGGLLGHGRSMMHDGLGWLTGSPADFSRPVFGSIRNTATLFPGMFAHSSHCAVRRDRQVLRPLPEARLDGDQRQPPVVADPVRRDAVVPAVRPVQEPAVRRDLQVGAVAGALEVVRERRDRLLLRQGAGVRVVVEHGDRVQQLVDDVDALAVRVERQVPRPGPGGRLGEGRLVRRQLRRRPGRACSRGSGRSPGRPRRRTGCPG